MGFLNVCSCWIWTSISVILTAGFLCFCFKISAQGEVKGIFWNYPPPSNSDHQDYSIFRLGNPNRGPPPSSFRFMNSICTVSVETRQIVSRYRPSMNINYMETHGKIRTIGNFLRKLYTKKNIPQSFPKSKRTRVHLNQTNWLRTWCLRGLWIPSFIDAVSPNVPGRSSTFGISRSERM